MHINRSSQELSWQNRVRFFSGRFPFISTWHTYMLGKFEQLFGVKWIEGTPWHTALLCLPVKPHSRTSSPFRARVHVRTSAACLSPITGLKPGDQFTADKYNCISYKRILVRMDFQYFVFQEVCLFHLYSCNLFPRQFFVILVTACQKPTWPMRGEIFCWSLQGFF